MKFQRSIQNGSKGKRNKKDGLIYFNPYWKVIMEIYVNTYPGCDAFSSM